MNFQFERNDSMLNETVIQFYCSNANCRRLRNFEMYHEDISIKNRVRCKSCGRNSEEAAGHFVAQLLALHLIA